MRATLLLLCLTASGFAADLRLDTATVAADKPAALNLRLQSGETELTGVQFEVEYDATRFDVTLEIGPAAEGASKVLQANTLQPGKQRVLIFGFNRNKISDGVVALARVSLKAGGEANQNSDLRIVETVGTNGAGESVPVKVVGSGETRVDKKSATRGEAR